jgi:hypothetical protein
MQSDQSQRLNYQTINSDIIYWLENVWNPMSPKEFALQVVSARQRTSGQRQWVTGFVGKIGE